MIAINLPRPTPVFLWAQPSLPGLFTRASTLGSYTVEWLDQGTDDWVNRDAVRRFSKAVPRSPLHRLMEST
jgi:hypothetical protein